MIKSEINGGITPYLKLEALGQKQRGSERKADDYEFPKKAKSREEIYNYLVHKNASGNCLHTFDISWKTYIRDGGA